MSRVGIKVCDVDIYSVCSTTLVEGKRRKRMREEGTCYIHDPTTPLRCRDDSHCRVWIKYFLKGVTRPLQWIVLVKSGWHSPSLSGGTTSIKYGEWIEAEIELFSNEFIYLIGESGGFEFKWFMCFNIFGLSSITSKHNVLVFLSGGRFMQSSNYGGELDFLYYTTPLITHQVPYLRHS